MYLSVYVHRFLYMCKHNSISQKHEEFESKDFHVYTMNPHYTLGVVPSQGKGQGTDPGNRKRHFSQIQKISFLTAAENKSYKIVNFRVKMYFVIFLFSQTFFFRVKRKVY